MTDYSSVEKQLQVISNCDESQLETFESYINNAISCVDAMLKSEEYENDSRIVYLCAVKAYYQIILAQSSNDSVISFKAGDVSYEKDTSSMPAVKELYETTLKDCATLLNNDSFSFKAV